MELIYRPARICRSQQRFFSAAPIFAWSIKLEETIFSNASKKRQRETELVVACCCWSSYLSFCHWTTSDANLLDDPHTFHYNDYFVIGGIRTCSGVSNNPMFLWISSNSFPPNLLLVRSHQAEIIIVKRLIQGRNNVTRVQVEPRSFDQGRRKNDDFTHSATLGTICSRWGHLLLLIEQEVAAHHSSSWVDLQALLVSHSLLQTTLEKEVENLLLLLLQQTELTILRQWRQ